MGLRAKLMVQIQVEGQILDSAVDLTGTERSSRQNDSAVLSAQLGGGPGVGRMHGIFWIEWIKECGPESTDGWSVGSMQDRITKPECHALVAHGAEPDLKSALLAGEKRFF